MKKELEQRKEICYARKIIDGTYKACQNEILACKRFLRDLERMEDDDFPYIFDTTRVDRFHKFFSQCPNTEDTTMLEMAEFQYFDTASIFGWVRKDNGARRWREVLIYQARGQGKSTLCATIGLYVLSADKIYKPYDEKNGVFEPNQYICLMAYDKDQTVQVRKPIIDMVNRSSVLSSQIDVGKGDSTKTYIRGKKRGGEIKAISKETKKLDGEKLNLIICDEWAAHTEQQRLATLMGSFGKRKQSMCVKITTAGSDCMTKPAKADYDRCVEILHDRIKDDRYLIIIRELDEKDNPADFSLYEKCSPMLREHNEYSERLFAEIQDEYNSAFNGGTEAQKIEYLIKRTNRWQVGSEAKFLDQDDIDKLIASQVEEDEFLEMIADRPTVCGADCSKVVDLTAESFIFKLPDDKLGIYAHGFMPSESLQRHNKTDKLPYEHYANEGYLSLIEGSYIDNAELKQYMCDFENDNGLEVKGFCADNAYAHQMLIDLEAGRTPNGRAYNVIECPQTTAVLNEPTTNFLKWLRAGKLVICKNELFIKHCANAYTESDKGGRVKVAKKNKDSYFRIDMLAATLFAIAKIDLLEGQNLVNALASGTFTF